MIRTTRAWSCKRQLANNSTPKLRRAAAPGGSLPPAPSRSLRCSPLASECSTIRVLSERRIDESSPRPLRAPRLPATTTPTTAAETTSPVTSTSQSAAAAKKRRETVGQVTQVINGTTFEIGAQRIRLIGIATASDGCEGEADNGGTVRGRPRKLMTLNGGSQLDQGNLYFTREKRLAYQVNRYVDVDGIDVGLAMLESGHARASGVHERRSDYAQADADAPEFQCPSTATTPPPPETATPAPETTAPAPPPPGPAPTIDITCPTKTSAAASLRAEFGYDFQATTPELVRWGIEYGDGRSYSADNEAKARAQVYWHWYRSPGTYTVTAWVEDAIGRRASDSCVFTWTQPPPSPRPPTTQPPAPQPEIVPDPPYQFEQTADGEPIRWLRLHASMRWRSRHNPAGEPSPGAIEVVRAAMAQISADLMGSRRSRTASRRSTCPIPVGSLPSLAEGEVVIGFAPPGSPAIPPSGT